MTTTSNRWIEKSSQEVTVICLEEAYLLLYPPSCVNSLINQFIVKLNTMRLLKEYYPASDINEKMIEELIKNKKQYFEETWPQQMRAYKNTHSSLDNRFIEYKNKADQLQVAMKAEIDKLRSENEKLQKINEKVIKNIV